MNIPVILGTAREGRQSENVAKYVAEIIKGAGHTSEVLDVKDYAPSVTVCGAETAQAKKYRAKIIAADAIIIVAPEYNHGYPGELKLMLDQLYTEYANKPVGFAGVSAGPLGGSRAVEQLRQIVIELRMIPVREALYFSKVQDLFNDKGITDPAMEDRVLLLVNDLVNHVYKKTERASGKK